MSQGSTVLVTGGAGYIGSHTVLQLVARGERVVVLDDLSTGFRQAVRDVPLVIGNVGERKVVDKLLAEHKIDSIIHFAAHTVASESVANPLKYYGNNTCSMRTLLEAAAYADIKHFVFSSTAAVYGMPASGVASEETPTAPINPYGTSKLMSEWMLRDLSAATSLRHVALRNFNAAGSDCGGRIGQSTRAATLLVKSAVEAAVGKRKFVSVYGTDYPTSDGTGVRDYIHVEDLATAHLNALDYLRAGGKSLVANCGYGHGYSVREVLSSVEQIAGLKLDIREEPRRVGDLPALIAKAGKVREVLGWQPKLDNIDTIVRTALEWERHLQREPW
jgi:UDP-glucose 4-epimerase